MAFRLAFAHGLLLGSERTTVWVNILYLTTASAVLFLTFYPVLATERFHTVLVGRDVAQASAANTLRAV